MLLDLTRRVPRAPRRFLAGVLAAATVASCAYAERYAIIVGVEDYQHADLRTPPLQYSVDDATELAKVLGDAGYRVTLLTDASETAPTKANIDAAVERVLRECGRGDTVLVAFSGHGMQFTDEAGAYFCPSDARPFARHRDSLVSIDTVFDEMEACFASTKLMLVDACRNDPDPARGRTALTAGSVIPPRGVGVLFSCSPGQRAFEHDDFGHGVFFYHVIQRLRQAEGDLGFLDLANYVSARVAADVGKLLEGRSQIPNLQGNLFGSPVVLSGQARRTAPGPLRAPFGRLQATQAVAEWADYLGQPAEFTNTLGATMKLIPAGRFRMGSGDRNPEADELPHQVYLTKAFYVGAHETTLAEFRRFIDETGYTTTAERFDGGSGRGWDASRRRFVEGPGFTWRKTGWRQDEDHPVVNVSWDDADRFVSWLAEKEGKPYRLMSEAEWEYCCRAGSTAAYSFGDRRSDLTKHGNVLDRTGWARFSGDPQFAQSNRNLLVSGDDRAVFTTSVGQYPANAFGLYDFHGNVCEWTRDWYTEAYHVLGERNPRGAAEGFQRCARGGRFDTGTHLAKASTRNMGAPGMSDMILGIRIAMDARK